MCAFGFSIHLPVDSLLIPVEQLTSSFYGDAPFVINNLAAYNNFLVIGLTIIAYSIFFWWISLVRKAMSAIGRMVEANSRDIEKAGVDQEFSEDVGERKSSVSVRCKVVKFIVMLVSVFLLYPLSWLLSFSYTFYEANGFVLGSEHILFALIIFALCEAFEKCCGDFDYSAAGFSNTTIVLLRFCAFYGAMLIGCGSVFLLYANDVMMIFVSKSILLQTQGGTAENIILERFNFVSSSLADYLVDTTLALYVPDLTDFAQFLATQTDAYRTIFVDSWWTLLFWQTVVVPASIGMLVLGGRSVL